MGHFLDPFLSFLTPFHVEGSYLVVRGMAQKWAKKWSKMGHFGVPPGGSKNGHSGKTQDLMVPDIPFLSFFVTFFVSNLVILPYFPQVATCGFWPKIDRKKLFKNADFRRLKFSGFSKSGPKIDPFFGHFLTHFWTKN